MKYSLGIDAGSTTVKFVLLDSNNKIVYKEYKIHSSRVIEVIGDMFKRMYKKMGNIDVKIAFTGSASLGFSKALKIDFIQEVYSTNRIVSELYPKTDVVIELGGEDAKILFLGDNFELRMNGTCAGGTGSFISQMAVLLDVDVSKLDDMALSYKKIYPIASRCGVFAKSDVQPLLNQGANKNDIAASIMQAVVDQTIVGLAQGRAIKGNILFLGGPLHYNKSLKNRFIETLKLEHQQVVKCNVELFLVALGAATYASGTKKKYSLEKLMDMFKNVVNDSFTTANAPLFESKEDMNDFFERHENNNVKISNKSNYKGDVYLGIDAGSTTIKVVAINEADEIVYNYYSSNKGNPLDLLKIILTEFYETNPNARILSSVVTGYGEELIKNAFQIDVGIVETMAHYKAAKHFNPNVDFIIDIGGQDIKCFKIKNDAIDSIMLNEACSSGCGSFISTLASSMGYPLEEFCKMALRSKKPVDLGSRCTVFMNSSIKQAQKEGASADDIAAGLSISIVKNALYKVIRTNDAKNIGKNIVVQGGTFLNDAVLRSFELETGANVVRPNIAGLMGAYGAALIAKEHVLDKSTILDLEELNKFSHTSISTNCKMCTSKCPLTINTFGENRKFISGNRCERPLGYKVDMEIPDIYKIKYQKIRSYEIANNDGPEIGIPLILNMFELLPLWYGIFKYLGFNIRISDESNTELYKSGYDTIPSDTICYPAKLSHGHIESLIKSGVKYIFYPAMGYNVNEHMSDNFYNCPVVAYYPEILEKNMPRIKKVEFIKPYLNVNDEKNLQTVLYKELNKIQKISKGKIKKAIIEGFKAYNEYKEFVRTEVINIVNYSREHDIKMILLAGRPYHIDPEINHGLNKLITGFGYSIISEDGFLPARDKIALNVLNQWTFQARLFRAAKSILKEDDINFVQLVSFGCGIDAITTDEISEILEKHNKLYTSLKIDEINNLGASKIRLRSLFSKIESDYHGNKK